MVLFVNACVRAESRTKLIAERFLKRLDKPYEEVSLEKAGFPPVNEGFLARRDRLVSEKKCDDRLFRFARQFAAADEIVIAAPFWDLSFPASLKQYFEQINVPGITFTYTSEGVPRGLCKAKRLTYITTAGGDFFPEEYGFGYVKALARNFYGISDVNLIKALGLDIYGADIEKIINAALDG